MPKRPVIGSAGELLVEFVASDRNGRHRRPTSYAGPFPSGAPGIFIDQAARVGAAALFRLAWLGERGLGKLDLVLAPATLLAIAALGQAAQAVELLILAGILLLGLGLLWLRQRLASRRAAR